MGNCRTKVIACATVIEEMLPLMPPDIAYEVLDFGLLEEIAGSTELIYRSLYGPWGDEFVITPPGQTIKYTHFKTTPLRLQNMPPEEPNS